MVTAFAAPEQNLQFLFLFQTNLEYQPQIIKKEFATLTLRHIQARDMNKLDDWPPNYNETARMFPQEV